jgi:hypothetical protein
LRRLIREWPLATGKSHEASSGAKPTRDPPIS